MTDGPTQLGFRWGNTRVEKRGIYKVGTPKECRLVEIVTPTEGIVIYINKAGKIRVFTKRVELLPDKRD